CRARLGVLLALLNLRVGPARARIRLGLDESVRHARLGFTLLCQLLGGDDPDDAAAIKPLQTARLENGVEGLLPGDIVERDGDLSLDIVASHDVAAALRSEDAQQVGDVCILEVQRDELAAAPRGLTARHWRRAGSRRRRRRRGRQAAAAAVATAGSGAVQARGLARVAGREAELARSAREPVRARSARAASRSPWPWPPEPRARPWPERPRESRDGAEQPGAST